MNAETTVENSETKVEETDVSETEASKKNEQEIKTESSAVNNLRVLENIENDIKLGIITLLNDNDLSSIILILSLLYGFIRTDFDLVGIIFQLPTFENKRRKNETCKGIIITILCEISKQQTVSKVVSRISYRQE